MFVLAECSLRIIKCIINVFFFFFQKLDLSLPAFGYNEKYKETLCPNPGWKAGDGANNFEIMSGEENINNNDTQEAWQNTKAWIRSARQQ